MTVEEEPELTETITAVAQELETLEEGTTIEIKNMDKVVTPEENAKLDALPLKEQLLTFLSVIGFEETVNRSLEASQETLSEPAVAVKEEIQARIAAMSEEEYEQFTNTLLESFPQEIITIDGVEYTFFVLELEVRIGDKIRYERYGFRREGDIWILTRLEIADQPNPI